MVDTGQVQALQNIEIGIVREEPVSKVTKPSTSFIRAVFPNQEIEFQSGGMLHGSGGVSPSSLFFQAACQAYAEHYAFGLRPEVLMYLITSVVAETVKRHPEDYRQLFSSCPNKVVVKVRHDGLRKGNPSSPWHEAIPMFEDGLRQHIPSQVMNHMLPSFSSMDGAARVASLVSFMDAASPFYDYRVMTRCGIPRVSLFGQAADYQKLLVAATELAELFSQHLKLYFDNLLPVLQEIAKTAETGIADLSFWGQIYKRSNMSGSDKFSGWLTCFLWYVNEVDDHTEQPSLMVKDPKLAAWAEQPRFSGIPTGSEPSHLSRVPFIWEYFDEIIPMHFFGGIVGIDNINNALTPALGYGVLNA